jgi:hypothetical protein
MTVLPQVQDELARAARRRARRRGPGRAARGGPAAVPVGGTLTAGATATGLIEPIAARAPAARTGSSRPPRSATGPW